MPTAIARLIAAAAAIATLIAFGNTNTVTSVTAGTTNITATSTADPTKSEGMVLTINPPGELRWTRQFGTNSDDTARGIATDTNDNVTTTGTTEGALAGPNAGSGDAFIRSSGR